MRQLVRTVAVASALAIAAVGFAVVSSTAVAHPAGAHDGAALDPIGAASETWRQARVGSVWTTVSATGASLRADVLGTLADRVPAAVPEAAAASRSIARLASLNADALEVQAAVAAAAEAAARDAVITAISERTGGAAGELRAAWAAAPPAALDVVAAGLTELGTPYRYGGAGPTSYDCSGFVAAAFAAIGVELPHQSAAQWALASPILVAGPADVLVHPGLGHIGLGIGAGIMVHAPQTGDVVKLSPVPAGDWAGRILAA